VEAKRRITLASLRRTSTVENIFWCVEKFKVRLDHSLVQSKNFAGRLELESQLHTKMASSSVSQEDHDVEHDFAMASRRAKVRSARANRTVNNAFNSNSIRGDDGEKDVDGRGVESNIPRYEQNSVVLVEQNDASPKPICRGINKDKRAVTRGAYAGKNNKGVRDRRKLREKRRSTGVMHLPSTESTGGSTGEDENNENSLPPTNIKPSTLSAEPEEKVVITTSKQGRSDSDLDADDEANNSGDVKTNRDEMGNLRGENERLMQLVGAKEKRIVALELQVAQLTRQISEIRDENSKLLQVISQTQSAKKSP